MTTQEELREYAEWFDRPSGFEVALLLRKAAAELDEKQAKIAEHEKPQRPMSKAEQEQETIKDIVVTLTKLQKVIDAQHHCGQDARKEKEE